MRNKAAIALSAVLVLALGGASLIGRTTESVDFGARTESFYGAHQNGIEIPAQANVSVLAFDLNAGVDKAAAGRLMRVWSSDTAKLTQGLPVIGDITPGAEQNPARLTSTFGFGFSFYEKLGIADQWPIAEKAIPTFKKIDKLQPQWSDGDIVVQIAGDDPLAIFHLAEMLRRDAKPFATVKWQQRGFTNAAGVNTGNVSRNLLGQIDGIVNPKFGSKKFAETVWRKDGGTLMVVRRIQMNLDNWDKLSSAGKTRVTGRKMSTGEKRSTQQANAHVKLAFTKMGEGILRRGYNYDDNYLGGVRQAGLIFISYQESLERFVKIQSKLAEIDALNIWTTPIGSGLYYVPKGVTSQDEWLMQDFLN
jgi:dye decolorizing peroxidase